MVRIAVILLGIISGFAHAEPDVFLRMEFSKPEIYAGEQVIANFMLYSREDILDVEVAKFPEFRGYWSENMSLRQGPIPLMSGFDGPYKKALIGSYILTAMVGDGTPAIVPMKIIVKHPAPDRQKDFPERSIYSEPQPLVTHPLPPLPPGLDPKGFFGAVGRFTLVPEMNVIPFQKEDPVTVRLILQGEGNFQELNRLDLPFPPQVEVLSRKAFTQGAGQYSNKTYEITLSSHSTDNFTVPSVPFIYFNPAARRYEVIQLPALQFQFTPALPHDKASESVNLELPGAAKSMRTYRPLSERWAFILLNVIFALTVIGLGAARLLREAKVRRESTVEFRRHLRTEQTRRLLVAGDVETFLRQADDIALEIVREAAKPAEPMSKSQLLRVLESEGKSALAGHARDIFAARDGIYAPVPRPPAAEKLAKSFDSVVTS